MPSGHPPHRACPVPKRLRRPGSGPGRGRRRSPSERCRPGRSRPGRGRRRRSPGRRTSAPPGSRRAIEPPPAPMVWMSSAGRRTGSPATSRPGAGSGTPPRTRQTSVLVPPMSNVTASGYPQAAATAAPARTPPAGPDSNSAAGNRAASSQPTQTTGRRHDQRLVGQPVQAREIGATNRPQVGVHDGRHRPLVLPELRRHFRRARHVDAPLRQHVLHFGFVRRVEIGVQKAYRRRAHVVGQLRKLAGRRQRCNLGPRGIKTAADLEPQFPRHQRRRPVGPDVIEGRAVLAADLDDVGEALGGHQGDARAAPFQQRVGGHRGAVGQQCRAGLVAQLCEPFSQRPARIVGSRQHLHDAPVGRHDIGEGPARVGADGQSRHGQRSVGDGRVGDDVCRAQPHQQLAGDGVAPPVGFGRFRRPCSGRRCGWPRPAARRGPR